MKNQRGFTLIELFAAVWFLVCLVGVGFFLYAVVHFVTMFW